MSVFTPGTGGGLNATTLPAAFFQMAQLLDAAEKARNGANPGVAPKNNLTTSIDFSTGTVAIAATIPLTVTLNATGQPVMNASDYLAAPYSNFTPGTGGQLVSTNVVDAFVEMAQTLSTAEKAVTPVEDQPNNATVIYDTEAATVTVTGNLPFTAVQGAAGSVTISTVDYL